MNNEQHPAQRELRGMAAKMLEKAFPIIDHNKWDFYSDPTVEVMLQFAAEQTELLKQRIAELEAEVKDWRSKYKSDMNFTHQ